ncbi:PREDICTED: tripartite motif-containing protein 2-like [Branchiostoma belcheri]|uniref:RING-type E3 ubiquitin transferase n=1 Tax=Branchiostoma belcheri TaxID=7741 RepID=A0A6P5AUM8_BRABE|nr:PREDICTED: tripartite motif-containing protein 2-like [Branchiostoma belcheri]
MASNAFSDIADEFLVCQVCLEDFKQPKMLPCLHTFCQPCLEKVLAAEPVGRLDCPTCRQDVPLPQNGVQGLKSNFLVGKLRDILQQQPAGKTSEAREDGVPCTVCEAGNSAQFYCVECADYLCQTCNDMHRRFKATKSHRVVTVQDLQSGQAAAELRARETSKCEDHSELNKFYCDTCQRVICLHCVVTAHKEHQYVEIEKAAEREGAKIKAKVATAKNTIGLHETWRQQLQSVRDRWPSEVRRTEEQVRKQVKAIIKAARKAGDNRIGQLRAMNAAREKQMDAAMEAAEMDLASARSCVQFADNVLEYGSPAEVISVAGELTGRLDRTAEDKNAERAELTMNFVNLTFDPPAGGLEQEVAKLSVQTRPWVKMASNAVSDIADEFLVCQVCLEDFKQPKMLPCLHTFCQPCLEKLLAAEPVGKLECPTCRQDVPLPQNGVQGLKSNFLVGKLRDILQQQPAGKTSEAREDGVPCTVCEAGNSAQFYCVECTDYLCHTCDDMHRRFKGNRSHKLVTVQDLQSGQVAAELRARKTSKCEDHRELNKFYCDTCQRVICLHCVVTAHKEHQYVEIEKAAEREGAKIKAKVVTIRNTVGLHETWRQQLQSVRDEWPSEVRRTEEQVRKQVKAIIEAAEKAGDDRIGQLHAMNAAREKQMDAAMEAAEMDLASARSCVQFADNVLEYGSPAEVISVAGELTGRLDRAAEDKNAERAELTMNFVNLTFDPPAGELEQEVAKLVGGINQVRTPLIPPTPQVRPNVAIGNGGVSLEHVKTVGGKKGSGDGQFNHPNSLTVTAEGDIVVTDCCNSRLQFLDKDGSFKKKIDLGFEPYCVAALTNGELLVTGDGHKIHVLDKQGRMSRVLQVTGAAENYETTRGVAVDRWGRIIVTIAYQVFVLSPIGDVMLKFGNKGRGPQQLGYRLRVTVNSSNQIIVSDFYNHNLKIFDSAGRHLFTCGSYGSGPGQLFWPDCVITDSEDNIIVADCFNRRVSLFSRDGAFIRHVLTREEHGLYLPWGLTLTHDGHLVVSEDSHSIKLFQVK